MPLPWTDPIRVARRQKIRKVLLITLGVVGGVGVIIGACVFIF